MAQVDDNSSELLLPPSNTSSAPSPRHVGVALQSFISVFYAFGIGGNVSALVILARNETQRNRRQTLMLRCLACNDLLALLGSLALMYSQLYLPSSVVRSHGFCAWRVSWRVFGLGSGCVAIVMAVERWLALTRPFVYQKDITSKLIARFIFALWAIAALLVCLPFLGFGLYYDPSRKLGQRCVRYRYATTPADIAYAYLFFTFGMLLSTCIVCCNILVIRVLCRLGEHSLARRSRTSTNSINGQLTFNHTTPEELSFARLMAILCIFFVVCWLPQMITIVAVQADPAKAERPFYRIADICIALNFTLDPYIYVLLRQPHRRAFNWFFKPLRCQVNGTCVGNTSHPSSLRDSDGSKNVKFSGGSKDTQRTEIIPIVTFENNHTSTSIAKQ